MKGGGKLASKSSNICILKTASRYPHAECLFAPDKQCTWGNVLPVIGNAWQSPQVQHLSGQTKKIMFIESKAQSLGVYQKEQLGNEHNKTSTFMTT